MYLLQAVIGEDVARRHVGQHAVAGGGIVFARRIVAAEVSAHGVGVGFAKGEIFVHEIADIRRDALDVAQITGEILLPLKSTLFLEPHGVCKSVQLQRDA